MKKIIAIIMVVLLGAMPSFAIPDGVTCTYHGYPLYVYVCSDSKLFRTEQAMVDYYTPALTQASPDYTFVNGGATQGLSGI